MRIRTVLSRVVIAVAALSSGCSTTSTSNSGTIASGGTGTTLSLAAATQAYEAAASVGNTALSAMVSRLNALSANPTVSQVATAVDPAIPALTQYETTLSHIDWPSSAESTDAHRVVEAVDGLVRALQSTSQPNGFSVATFETQLASATAQAGTAVNALRTDLGLPPNTTTTSPAVS